MIPAENVKQTTQQCHYRQKSWNVVTNWVGVKQIWTQIIKYVEQPEKACLCLSFLEDSFPTLLLISLFWHHFFAGSSPKEFPNTHLQISTMKEKTGFPTSTKILSRCPPALGGVTSQVAGYISKLGMQKGSKE